MAAERTPLTFVRFGPSQRFLRGLPSGPSRFPRARELTPLGGHHSPHITILKRPARKSWSVFFVDVTIFRSA